LDDRTVLKDPNADEQHVFESPGKLLKKSQGLLIPWYLARKDYDYLVLPRPVVVPVANVVNPFSDPVSFAVKIVSADCPELFASCINIPMLAFDTLLSSSQVGPVCSLVL
jgi:hypothetical protein